MELCKSSKKADDILKKVKMVDTFIEELSERLLERLGQKFVDLISTFIAKPTVI